jgi:hypothetical protein
MAKLADTIQIESDTDLVLTKGSMWVTVGNLSVYIAKRNHGVKVEILPLNNETGAAIASAYAYFSDAPAKEEGNPDDTED